MDYKFIIKPGAGSEFEKKLASFQKKGIGKVEKSYTEKGGKNSAFGLAEKAVRGGFERIVFVGGDGLVNEGVNGIMSVISGKKRPELAVGIIPSGAGNDFAKGLGIERNLKGAFENLKKGKAAAIDLGKVNTLFFTNCVSFGFDAKINRTANLIKERYKFLPKSQSYLLSALKEIIFDFSLYYLEIKGTKKHYHKDEVVLAAITNAPTYGGIFRINPQADMRDGILNLCYIKKMGRLKALRSINSVIKGTHLELPEVESREITALDVSSPKPVPWQVDGEVQEPAKEFKIKVVPQALKFLIP